MTPRLPAIAERIVRLCVDFAPYWAYQSPGTTLLLASPPLLVALTLMRSAGRGDQGSRR